MAKRGKTSLNRYSPPLMHAFRQAFKERDSTKKIDQRDAAGERVVASRRLSKINIVNEETLRQQLSIDLNALMNTVSMSSSEDISELQHVKKSILNFGLEDIAHLTLEERGVNEIQNDLFKALIHYEPRLIKHSIEVERDTSVDISKHNIRFMISAEMHATPMDVPVEFLADLELSSGKMKISKL